MNKYKLQINDIKKYAQEFWGDTNKVPDENSQSYINYMNKDTSELHNHICEALVVANHWGNNCSIAKGVFTIQEIASDNSVVKTYTYQEAWDLLPKMKVNYIAEMGDINRSNIDTMLEPLTDVATGKVVCMTNSGNHMYMIHTDLLDDFLNSSNIDETIECPVYLLDKAHNKPNGALNKYFDKDEKF